MKEPSFSLLKIQEHSYSSFMNRVLQDKRAVLIFFSGNRSYLILYQKIEEVPYSLVTNRRAFLFFIKDSVAHFFLKDREGRLFRSKKREDSLILYLKLRSSPVL